ncbi:MAG: ComEC/Rec2 family competence protein [Candidatus Eremiobacteraeota bacterium]|nr:ComEC/Rec2 family competence protein [Candidatus Eremiobacteraeota bacterium]
MNPSRIVILITSLLAIGIYLTKVYSIAFYVSVPLIILSFILCMYFYYEKKNAIGYAFLGLAIFSLGCILTHNREVNILEKQIHVKNNEIVFIQGMVMDPPEILDNKIKMKIRVLRMDKDRAIEKRKVTINAILFRSYIETVDNLQPGYVIEFSGRLRKPQPPTNPGEFDSQWYMHINGISGTITPRGSISIVRIGKISPVWNLVYKIRSNLKSLIYKSLPYPDSTVLAGILLGRRKELPLSTEKIFRDTGTLHILAASGLHVSILIASLILFFRLIGFKSRFSSLLVIPLVLLYALLAGVSPSIVRASIMGTIFLIATCIGKDYHYLNSLFISALIMLVINPYNLFLPGFQLSFTIVLGVLMFYKPIISLFTDREKIRKYLKKHTTDSISVILSASYRFCISILVISIIVQITVIPISAFYFNRISLVNILSNFIVVPLSSILIPVGFIGGLAAMLHAGIGELIISILYLPLHFSIQALSFLGNFSFSTISIPSPSPIFFIFYYSLLLLYGIKYKPIKKYRLLSTSLLIASLSVLAILSTLELAHTNKAIVFDTEKIGVVLMQRKRECFLFIYGQKEGWKTANSELSYKVLPYLKKKGLSEITALVITGEGNMEQFDPGELIDEIPVRKIFVYPQILSSKSREQMANIQEKSTLTIYEVTDDYDIKIMDINMKIYGPEQNSPYILKYQCREGDLQIVNSINEEYKIRQNINYSPGKHIIIYIYKPEVAQSPGTKTIKNEKDYIKAALFHDKISSDQKKYRETGEMSLLKGNNKYLIPQERGAIIFNLMKNK